MSRLSFASLLALMLLGTSVRAQFSQPRIKFTPTGCQDVFVNVDDVLPADGGLSEVEVLYDPDGIYTGKSIVSYNVQFDGPEPPDYYGNTSDSFRIKVIDPTDTAYLAVWAVNHSGRSSLQEWHFRPIALSKAVTGSLINDSIGATTCADFTLTNNDTAITFSGIGIPSRPGFTFSNLSPAAGTILKKGDRITFHVCFKSESADTIYDTLVANIGCFTIPFELMGSGRTPMISAENVNFTSLELDDTACEPLRVWNRGNAALWVSGAVSPNSEFTLSGPSPALIEPDSFRDFEVYFEPKGHYGPREMQIQWHTNQPPEYPSGYKDISYITANAAAGDLHWDRVTALYDPANDTTLDLDVLTFTITNTSKSAKVLDSIMIVGPEAATFVSFTDYSPTFPKALTLSKDQSDTVKIQWQPIPPPPIEQTAVAYIMSGGVATDSLFLTGLFPSLSVSTTKSITRFEMYPNPLTGNSLHLTVGDANPAMVDVRNILGQSVISYDITGYQNDITLPDLNAGLYFVRMTQRGVTQTKQLIIER